ncbi:MAG TPA: helix-hairpin-helix domain-containing protein [Gemmatimonadaceae bacterium]
MPTPAEHRALVFLSALLLLGVGFRAGASLGPEPSTIALDRQLAAVDSARQQSTSRRRSRGKSNRSAPAPRPRLPAGAGAAGGATAPPPTIYYAPAPGGQPGASASSAPVRVDMDVATAAQIEQLPRIGPVLARRIVADRDSLGPFGSLKELRRVKGVGPALARAVEPYVTFSLQPRPHGVLERGDRGSARGTRGRSRRPRSK